MKLRKKRVWTKEEIKLNEQSTTLTAQLHGLSCPTCGNRKYAKNGKEKGNQRYTCCRCGKHFRSTTGCTIHHLHLKPKIQEYIQCMNQGMTLRKTAEKCDISLQTAFRWRHRFLKAMGTQPAPNLHENRVLSALVLPFSSKGKPEAGSQNSNVVSILQIDTTRKITINVLGEFGQPGNRLINITKGRTSYIASKSIPNLLKSGMSKYVTKEQVLKTQEITDQIHSWLAKFRGVASKYLENYWRWFAHISHLQLPTNHHLSYMHNCF